MSALLPLFLLALVLILQTLTLYSRPDPKHLFMLELLTRMQGDEDSCKLKSNQC